MASSIRQLTWQPTGLLTWPLTWPLTCLLLATLFVSACRKEAEGPAPVVEDLEYVLNPSGARIVSGTLYNPSAEPIGNLQIQVSLFDEDNSFVGSMNIVVSDIEAGGRVPFREPVDSDDVHAARVKSIVVM